MPTARFHDGHSGATHLVRVVLGGGALTLRDAPREASREASREANREAIWEGIRQGPREGASGGTRATWPLERVKPAREVDPDGVVALTATGFSGVLLVDDPAELEALRNAGLRLPRDRRATGTTWVWLAGGVAATLALGVGVLNTAPQVIAPMIPAAWERQLAVPTEALLLRSATKCDGAEGQRALERLVARLRAAGAVALPVELTVLDDPMVNAFTLPGGKVVVMRGLIREAEDGAELAGVLAHELGHVAHHDSTAMLLRAFGISVLLHALGLGDAAGAVAEGAGNLLSLAYGRAAETAADDSAIAVLTAAGLRADGLSRFFGHMEGKAPAPEGAPDGKDVDARKSGPRRGVLPGWLSTHPASDARRDRTARPDTGEMPFTDAEWKAIRGMCAGPRRR